MVIIALQENKDLSALQNGIHVTKYYGPKYLRGKLTKINTKRIYHLTRQANVLGKGQGESVLTLRRHLPIPVNELSLNGLLLLGQSKHLRQTVETVA